jgi:RNA polymerase sigma factor (sigma-70 family)
MATLGQLNEVQQLLAEEHMGWALDVARLFSRRHPRWELDLESAALLGLCEAARRYSPEIGVKFRTYASHRVSGAIKRAIRQCRLTEVMLPETGHSLDAPSSPSGYHTDEIESFESRIRHAPERYRPLLRLLFVHDLTMAAAARDLGVSPALVSAWYAQALRHLGATSRRRYQSNEPLSARAS